MLAIAAGFALPMAAEAALLTVNNFSFENPAANAGNFSGNIDGGPAGWGWTVVNTAANTPNGDRAFGVWNPAGTPSYNFNTAPDGNNVGVIFLNNTTNLTEAALQQTLAATVQLATRYTLTVEVGNFAPSMPTPQAPWNFTGFPGYRVELLAGGTVLASDNNTLLPAEGQFLTSTVVFPTSANPTNFGQPLGIRLVNLNGPGVEVNFDRVRLDATAIPEPSSTALMAFVALLAWKRRRVELR